MPKVMIPFVLAATATIIVWASIPPGSIMAFYIRHAGVPYFAFLSAVGVVSLIGSCAWVKGKIVAAFPKDLTVVAARLNEFPGVDFYEFERYTIELQQLGFVWQTDYRTQTSKVDHPLGIARVMLHPEHRCFVEINQLSTKGKVLKVHCSIMSYALLRELDARRGTDAIVSVASFATASDHL
jgi:hypothetical protein